MPQRSYTELCIIRQSSPDNDLYVDVIQRKESSPGSGQKLSRGGEERILQASFPV